MRAETSVWDNLVVPSSLLKSKSKLALYRWVAVSMPEENQHDFVISTDGSGANDGIGAAAAIVGLIDTVDGRRSVQAQRCYVSANYGESVQRNELGAFIAGVRIALQWSLDIGTVEKLSDFANEDRIRIMWYTDRRNLADSFLYDEHGSPINRRSSDRDLWAQWAYFARYVCITPICLPRNTEANQAACDGICTIAREGMKTIVTNVAKEVESVYVGHITQKSL